MQKYPNPASWDYATPRQSARAGRSFAILKERNVPVFSGPLMTADDDEVKLQSASDVARRLLVLWAVELRAEGIPQSEARGLIEQQKLWSYVSPMEKKFLEEASPNSEQCQALIWRLESIWVLLWASGYLKELDWPSGMCDVPALVELIKPLEGDPEYFANAKLRTKAEILDAQDLIMRVHWAIRTAYLKGGMIPEDLNWSDGCEYVPVTTCAAVGVVEQRHYALNWLVNFLDPEDWDSVDTPT